MSAVPSPQPAEVAHRESLAEAWSAFLDGEAELPSQLDAEARARWDTYHLIGDVLRTPDLAQPVSARFQSRLLQALHDEPTVLAPRPRPLRQFLKRYAAPGVTLAVAVVAVTWALQPYVNPLGAGTALQAALPAHEVYAANALRTNPDIVDYYDVHRHVAGMSGATQVSYAPGRE